MQSIQLRQIEVFRCVYDANSVTGAAAALGISQPAVSKHLAALERACGFLLFARKGGRLAPTPEGQLFALEIERLFQNVSRLEHIARAIAERRQGNIRIASFPALANHFLPGLLAPILTARPELKLTLESRTTPRVIEMAINQGMDLGLSLLPVDHQLVECISICTFRMVCVLPRQHRLAARALIRATDLRDELFISLGGADRSRMIIDQAFGYGHPRPRTQIEAPMAETACHFVANGMGVSIVPPFVADAFKRHDLLSLPFRPAVTMRIYALVPIGNPVATVTREIAAHLREGLASYHVMAPS